MEIRNVLYDTPAFYNIALRERHEEIPGIVERFITNFFDLKPSSYLDIGCGTGVYLSRLAKRFSRCVGTDLSERMIAHGRDENPSLDLRVADMRTMRLGERYELVSSFGSAITYALTDEDLSATIQTYREHLTPEGKLLISCWNASSFLGTTNYLNSSKEYDLQQNRAIARTSFSFDRAGQLLLRKRQWNFADGTNAEDICAYRLLFPEELRYRFKNNGLLITGIYDDADLKSTSLSNMGMYITARRA